MKKKLLALIGLVISIQLHFLKIDELERFFFQRNPSALLIVIPERLTFPGVKFSEKKIFFYLLSFSFPNAAAIDNSFLHTKNMMFFENQASCDVVQSRGRGVWPPHFPVVLASEQALRTYGGLPPSAHRPSVPSASEHGIRRGPGSDCPAFCGAAIERSLPGLLSPALSFPLGYIHGWAEWRCCQPAGSAPGLLLKNRRFTL